MPRKRDQDDITPRPRPDGPPGPIVDPLVTVETQREADLFSGAWAERTFVKLYVAARESGLLAAISDRDWKTLCTLATYMDGEGYCHPSQAELAKAMGCSRQMANERIKSLANFRFRGQRVLLVAKEDRTAKGEWARNGYRVLPISRLRIYDVAGPQEPIDSGNDTADEAGRTVSSRLDTVPGVEPTVSSPTVTVPLDTNKNQPLEREVNRSNFEGSDDDGDGPETASVGGEDHAAATAATNGVRPQGSLAQACLEGPVSDVGRSEPATYVPLGRLRELRRQAATTIGTGRTGLAGAPRDAGATPAGPAADGRSRLAGLKGTTEEREQLAAFLKDFAAELGDEAPLSSTITRALNIFRAAGVPRERWGDALYGARAATQEHSAQVRKQAAAGGSGLRRKNKVPYFMAVLEQIVGLRPASADQAPRSGGGE